MGMAAALQVAPQWLLSGRGDSPDLTGPLPPRPGTFDQEQWVELEPRYEALEGFLLGRESAGKPVPAAVADEARSVAANTKEGRTLDVAAARELVEDLERRHKARAKGRAVEIAVEDEGFVPPAAKRRRKK